MSPSAWPTESGAVAVLAHPFSLGLDPAGTESTVAELASYGLGGVEAIYGRYTPDGARPPSSPWPTGHGLAVTGGSDHHGTFKPDLQVGIGRGDLDVPDGVARRAAGPDPAGR